MAVRTPSFGNCAPISSASELRAAAAAKALLAALESGHCPTCKEPFTMDTGRIVEPVMAKSPTELPQLRCVACLRAPWSQLEQ